MDYDDSLKKKTENKYVIIAITFFTRFTLVSLIQQQNV